MDGIFDKSGGQQVGLHPLDVVDVGLMLCSALAAVHRGARSLHLDVKPSNVLLKPVSSAAETASTTANNEGGGAPQEMIALLSDFGLSRLVPACVSTKLESKNTSTAQRMAEDVGEGTIGYAPPEQLLERKGRRRSDVYGLGATLAFALNGQRPYRDMTSFQIMRQFDQGVARVLRWLTSNCIKVCTSGEQGLASRTECLLVKDLFRKLKSPPDSLVSPHLLNLALLVCGCIKCAVHIPAANSCKGSGMSIKVVPGDVSNSECMVRILADQTSCCLRPPRCWNVVCMAL